MKTLPQAAETTLMRECLLALLTHNGYHTFYACKVKWHNDTIFEDAVPWNQLMGIERSTVYEILVSGHER